MQAIAGVLADCTTTPLENLLLLVKDKPAGTVTLRDPALITNIQNRQAHGMLMAAERTRRWAATRKLQRNFSDSRLRAAIQGGELQTSLVKASTGPNQNARIQGALGPHMRSIMRGGASTDGSGGSRGKVLRPTSTHPHLPFSRHCGPHLRSWKSGHSFVPSLSTAATRLPLTLGPSPKCETCGAACEAVVPVSPVA